MTELALQRLMHWLSPAFPVGAVAYSHGLEAAVEKGLVTDADGLGDWIGFLLDYGSARADAGFFVLAWHAVREGREDDFISISERAAAQRGSAELALENTAQGEAFLLMIGKAWGALGSGHWQSLLREHRIAAGYPIAVATAGALAEIPPAQSLTAYLSGFVANVTSAALRLIPLGQTDGQKVISALENTVTAAVERALADPDISGAAIGLDLLSISHETQYTRLFRS